MIKRLLIIFSITSILFLFFSKSVFAGWVDLPMSACQSNIGLPSNLCCHNTGGCSSKCGTIPWYGWCYASGCQGYQIPSDEYGICQYIPWAGVCYETIVYKYSYSQCSAVDSCLGGAQLNAGLCTSSGCAKGGNYKICCKDDQALQFVLILVQAETL